MFGIFRRMCRNRAFRCGVRNAGLSRLGRFLHFAAANARGADADPFGRALHDSVDCLQIEVPAAFGYVMRVADAVPELGSAPANFTYFRHDNIAPLV